MNDLKISPRIAAEGFANPTCPEVEVTSIGGMATCPTSAIYSVPVRSGTPVEAILGQLPQLPVRMRYLQTWPSLDLSSILGPTIAETLSACTAPTAIPSCRLIEHQEAVRRLSVATHLSGAIAVWEEAQRTIERLEVPSRNEPGPRSWEAFKELAVWLGATDGELAGAIGIGRTTVYSWQREGREPRRGTARRLHQLHAALRALRRRLGGDGLDAWLAAGDPSRQKLILGGELGGLGEEIDAQLFATISQPDLAAVPADRGGVDPLPAATPPRPSKRRPRRTKLR